MQEMCSEMNLDPKFLVQVKHLALDGCIPRDVPWIKQQIQKVHDIERQLRLPSCTLLHHMAHNARVLVCVDELVPRFQRLATLLDTPAASVAKVVTYCQGLLLRDSDDIREVINVTCSQLTLPPRQVIAAVMVWPYMLLREARTHNALCRRLQWYLSKNSIWSAELRRLPPNQLALVLQCDHARLDRLEYLVSMKFAPREPVGLVAALKPSDDMFEATWPRFREWCIANNLVGTRAE